MADPAHTPRMTILHSTGSDAEHRMPWINPSTVWCASVNADGSFTLVNAECRQIIEIILVSNGRFTIQWARKYIAADSNMMQIKLSERALTHFNMLITNTDSTITDSGLIIQRIGPKNEIAFIYFAVYYRVTRKCINCISIFTVNAYVNPLRTHKWAKEIPWENLTAAVVGEHEHKNVTHRRHHNNNKHCVHMYSL